eukprot:CAMPEP_0176206186 /NCGR_PEP_ID=MMETSP0121_2-20121125/11978_1 /TAXON_ID=160619 /ORGANISM="Kryptoperidinium foliaceum, Strain CCMP 1326" /LENGTH=308 /DNA_ID=CAMNT_0017545139 /DNA_START=24 /DNA_END=949 /DNA_ORIENTATION=+
MRPQQPQSFHCIPVVGPLQPCTPPHALPTLSDGAPAGPTAAAWRTGGSQDIAGRRDAEHDTLARRFAEQEGRLEETEHKVGVLTEMLRVATGEMECLGEEADKEDAAAAAAVAASEAYDPAEDEELRAEIASAQATREALQAQLDAASRSEAPDRGARGALVPPPRRVRPGAMELTSRALALSEEARRMREAEERSWHRRASSYDRLASQLAGLGHSVEWSSSPRPSRTAEGELLVEIGETLGANAGYAQEVVELRLQLATAEEAIRLMAMRQVAPQPHTDTAARDARARGAIALLAHAGRATSQESA